MVGTSPLKGATASLMLLALVVLGSGCALTYTTRDGSLRKVGFMAVESRREGCIELTTTETVGVALDLSAQTGGFSVGYRRITTAEIDSGSTLELEERENRLEPRLFTCIVESR